MCSNAVPRRSASSSSSYSSSYPASSSSRRRCPTWWRRAWSDACDRRTPASRDTPSDRPSRVAVARSPNDATASAWSDTCRSRRWNVCEHCSSAGRRPDAAGGRRTAAKTLAGQDVALCSRSRNGTRGANYCNPKSRLVLERRTAPDTMQTMHHRLPCCSYISVLRCTSKRTSTNIYTSLKIFIHNNIVLEHVHTLVALTQDRDSPFDSFIVRWKNAHFPATSLHRSPTKTSWFSWSSVFYLKKCVTILNLQPHAISAKLLFCHRLVTIYAVVLDLAFLDRELVLFMPCAQAC